MDPEQQTTDSTAQISVEPQPAAPPQLPVFHMVGILVLAATLTVIVRRIGKIQTANKFRRWLPILYVSIWGVAGMFITLTYASALPDYWVVVVGLFVVATLLASVGWMRSVTAGLALAMEGRLKIGDAIRLQHIEGEIYAFGLRSVRVRSVDGTIHEVPNEKFMSESVANLSGDGGDSACEITLKVPPLIEPNRALVIARNAAILTPLASPQHQPEVFLNTSDETDESFEVHVRGYAFDPSYQDHYRSDVVARFHDDFRREKSGTKTSASGLVLVEE